MLRTRVWAYGGLLLALSASPSLAEPIIQPNELTTDIPGQSIQWLDNQLHAAHSHGDDQAVIDVNDRFVIKSDRSNDLTTVALGVLDGTRARYGTCSSGINPESGDPRTTWVQISHSDVAEDGLRDFTVRRTLDFYGNDRVYRFRSRGDGEIARLEPGISIEFDDGLATYVQTTGPIGTSGDTEAVRLAYQLFDSYDMITTSVELDWDMWSVSTDLSHNASSMAYNVNDATIIPHSAGSSSDELASPIIAAPVTGPGIVTNGPSVWLAADQPSDQRDVDDVETSDEQTDGLLCIARRCLVRVECFSGGPSCDCFGVFPSGGVCLL